MEKKYFNIAIAGLAVALIMGGVALFFALKANKQINNTENSNQVSQENRNVVSDISGGKNIDDMNAKELQEAGYNKMLNFPATVIAVSGDSLTVDASFPEFIIKGGKKKLDIVINSNTVIEKTVYDKGKTSNVEASLRDIMVGDLLTVEPIESDNDVVNHEKIEAKSILIDQMNFL